MRLHFTLLAGTALGLLAMHDDARAQGADTGTATEIIVTAQKRAERLQDVPLAVSAVDANTISDRGFTNIAQISTMVPNVRIDEGIVNPTLITPFIRGIGTIDNGPEVDMPIAVSIDGVYLASVYGGLIDAFDIQQVEVLRGPQGTLQGRNAPGGAVNIITRRPGDHWVARGMFEYGRFEDVKVNIGFDGPLVPDLVGIKLAALYRNAQGFQKGIDWNGTLDRSDDTFSGVRYGGRDSLGLKGGLSITPSDAINIWLSADYTKDKSKPTAFRDVNDGKSYPRPEYADELNTAACTAFGWCTPSPKYHSAQSFFGNNDVSNWGVSANMDFDLGPATLTSVTGYRKIKDTNRLDIDATPFPALETKDTTVNQKTFSQEIRLASDDDGALSANGLLRWVIGGYYMNSRMTRDQELFAFGNSIGNDYGQKLKSHALFGHVDIKPTEQLTISLGARESWDKKKFAVFANGAVVRDPPLTAQKSWKKFMYDANISYKLSPSAMIYARYAVGSRPGGFNQNLITYGMETVKSYEAGLKTDFLDRKVTFNATGFYYKYTDIQRQTSVAVDANGDGTPESFSRYTTNAGASHAWGARSSS